MDNEPNSLVRENINRLVKSFQTAAGSVYVYDKDGKTTRFKTATGEQMDRQDITVFSTMTPDEEQLVLNSYRHLKPEYKKYKVYVGEKSDDDKKVSIISKREEIKNLNKLCLYIWDTEAKNITWFKDASLEPKIGWNVFDIRHFDENGVTYAERHFGNKVVGINYEGENNFSFFETNNGIHLYNKDVTVFGDFDQETIDKFSKYIQQPDGENGVIVLERQDDNSQKIIVNKNQITRPDNLYLGVVNIKTNERVFTKKVSQTPSIGNTVFEYTYKDKNGKPIRNFGERVIKVN